MSYLVSPIPSSENSGYIHPKRKAPLKLFEMNDLLEFTGALLYFTLSIILFPLFLLLEFMLWSVVAARKMNGQVAKWKLATRRRNVGYQLRHLFAFVWKHQ